MPLLLIPNYEYSYHLEVFVFLKIDIAILMNFILKGNALDANNLQFKNIIMKNFIEHCATKLESKLYLFT